MRNITTPIKAVSIEDALRKLASKLTGKPAASLPCTQEAVVQYMAENVPSLDELVKAVTHEVMARMAPTAGEEPQNGELGGSDASKPQVAPQTRKRKTKTE